MYNLTHKIIECISVNVILVLDLEGISGTSDSRMKSCLAKECYICRKKLQYYYINLVRMILNTIFVKLCIISVGPPFSHRSKFQHADQCAKLAPILQNWRMVGEA